MLIVSDGLQARIGSLTAKGEWFKVWRTVDGEADAPKSALELEVMVRGVFEKRRFLDLLEHFIAFEEDPDTGALGKIIAGYHQFHAVNAAIEETVRASGMGDASGGQHRTKEDPGGYWAGHHARRQTRRPARGRRLAHAGERQELLYALLHGPHGAPPSDAEPDRGRAHRP